MTAAEAFAKFATGCPYRIVLPVERRPANALCLEIGAPAPRCKMKTPSHWPAGADALRWLASGGNALVFGNCSRACALGQRWCDHCGHRTEHHHKRGGCLVRDGEFACECNAAGTWAVSP